MDCCEDDDIDIFSDASDPDCLGNWDMLKESISDDALTDEWHAGVKAMLDSGRNATREDLYTAFLFLACQVQVPEDMATVCRLLGGRPSTSEDRKIVEDAKKCLTGT